MRKVILALCALTAVLTLSVSARSDDGLSEDDAVVPVETVLSMMAKLPACETCTRGYPWDRLSRAKAIARVISIVARDEMDAAELVVNGMAESGFFVTAMGDGGRSHGWLQLGEIHTRRQDAENPLRAAQIWLAMADASREACSNLPENQQLAQVYSGNCAHGHVVAARRAALVERILFESESLGD
jgi:hypothetical protein